jgi:hypothetical protein
MAPSEFPKSRHLEDLPREKTSATSRVVGLDLIPLAGAPRTWVSLRTVISRSLPARPVGSDSQLRNIRVYCQSVMVIIEL